MESNTSPFRVAQAALPDRAEQVLAVLSPQLAERLFGLLRDMQPRSRAAAAALLVVEGVAELKRLAAARVHLT